MVANPATPLVASTAAPVVANPLRNFVSGRFENLAEWLCSIGDIPVERIVTNPWMGTATEADLLQMTEAEDRGVELVDGTLVEKPLGNAESKLAVRLVYYLMSFVEPRRLGELTGEHGPYRLKNGNIRMPDVAFVAAEVLLIPPENLAVPQIPFALAVEVLSKTNTKREMQIKLKEYFDSGTRLMWIVDPKAQTVAVFDAVTESPSKFLTITDTLDGGDVLPGFALPLSQLFTAPI